jgi:hypothetical protein
MLSGHWKLLFPIGEIGCVDVARALKGKIRYSRVEELRRGSPIVNIGALDDEKLGTCRADFAIFSFYDRYKAEPRRFGHEITRYEKLAEGGTLLKVFRPERGESGGPIIRVIKLSRSAKSSGTLRKP